MSDSALHNPGPKESAPPLIGVAGCGITFMLTALGALVGGVIGLLKLSPMPPRGGEYDGLLYLIGSFFHAGGRLIYFGEGAAIGGAAGLVVGIVIAVMHVRRVKAATKSGDASHE